MTISMTRQWWETLQKGAYIGRAGSHEVWQHEMDVHPVWDNLSQIPSLSDMGLGRPAGIPLTWEAILVTRVSRPQLTWDSGGQLWATGAPVSWSLVLECPLGYLYSDEKTIQWQPKDNTKTIQRQCKDKAQEDPTHMSTSPWLRISLLGSRGPGLWTGGWDFVATCEILMNCQLWTVMKLFYSSVLQLAGNACNGVIGWKHKNSQFGNTRIHN